MIQKVRSIAFIFAFCIVMTACQGIKGLKVHNIGEIWETDGNAITVTEAFIADCYEANNGTIYTPDSGDELFVVKVRAIFAEGWSFSSENVSLDLSFYSDTLPYSLCCTPICENSNTDGQEYVLLFSGNFTKEKNYELVLEIMQSEGVERSQRIFLGENIN